MLSQIAASCSALAGPLQLCPLPKAPQSSVWFLGWGWAGLLPLQGGVCSSLQMETEPATQAQWR